MRRFMTLLGLATLAALVALAACKNGDGGSSGSNDGDSDGCGEVSAAVKGDPVNGPPVVDGEIVTTGSCLRYIDTEVGSGAAPEAGDTIVVHYSGYLEDGTKFDSSVDRGQPFVFAIGTRQVIPGWDEGLATLQVGGKRRLIIPPELGYGPDGSPPVIPGNATLIFDVELLEIQ